MFVFLSTVSLSHLNVINNPSNIYFEFSQLSQKSLLLFCLLFSNGSGNPPHPHSLLFPAQWQVSLKKPGHVSCRVPHILNLTDCSLWCWISRSCILSSPWGTTSKLVVGTEGLVKFRSNFSFLYSFLSMLCPSIMRHILSGCPHLLMHETKVWISWYLVTLLVQRYTLESRWSFLDFLRILDCDWAGLRGVGREHMQETPNPLPLLRWITLPLVHLQYNWSDTI